MINLKDLTFYLHHNELPPIPLAVKMFLRKFCLFSGTSYKNTIKYNSTNKFTKIILDDKELSNDDLIVRWQQNLFFYESSLEINQNVKYTIDWSLLARKKTCRANKKLCSYMTAIMAQQLGAVLFSIESMSKKDIQELTLDFGYSLSQNQRFFKKTYDFKKYTVEVLAINMLVEVLGGYQLTVDITNKNNENTIDKE